MWLRQSQKRRPRRGAIVVFVAVLLIPLLALVAFAVDIGYIKVIHGELQNAADAAALAGTSQLLDRDELKGLPPGVSQAAEIASARTEAIKFALANTAGNVALQIDANNSNDPNGDIVIGHLANPQDPNSPMSFTTYPYNSVKVRVRRTNAKNGPINLFFARYLGHQKVGLETTATATYEAGINGFKIKTTGPKYSKLLPYALDVSVWNLVIAGIGPDNWSYDPVTDTYSPGSDGIKEAKLFPNKGIAPGNWGTIDIGSPGNSSSELARQIREGPNQKDLSHYPDGEFKLGPNGTLVTGGDTGISAGVKDELASIRGQPRVIPLYLPPVIGTGNNAQFTIVGFAGIIITEVDLVGGNKFMTIQPEYVDDGTGIGGGDPMKSRFITKPLSLTR